MKNWDPYKKYSVLSAPKEQGPTDKLRARDYMEDAVVYAQSSLGMSGTYKIEGNRARAELDPLRAGMLGPVLDLLEFVISGRVSRLDELIFQFGIHWRVKDRKNVDTKLLRECRYNPDTGEWFTY